MPWQHGRIKKRASRPFFDGVMRWDHQPFLA